MSRNGDLIHRVYLRVELPSVSVAAGKAFRWLNWLGHILVKNVEIEIGQDGRSEGKQSPLLVCVK